MRGTKFSSPKAPASSTFGESTKFSFSRVVEEDGSKSKFLNEVTTGFKTLWESKDFSDFTIVVGPSDDRQKIEVHRNILAIRSSYFAAAFKAPGEM
jgi:hypothetical protein